MRFGTFHEAEEAMVMLELGQLVMIVGWLVTAEGQLVVPSGHQLLLG
jgi:hypothetical protein